MKEGFIPQNDFFDDELNEQDFCLRDKYFYPTKTDFYPPSDNRFWQSNVKDINGGDNFGDYCKYFFGLLDEVGYYDN